MATVNDVAKLQAEIDALKAQLAAKNTLSFKVSEKGGVSVIGLQRFPVTLYKSQWERLLAETAKLKAFIEVNNASLKQGKTTD